MKKNIIALGLLFFLGLTSLMAQTKKDGTPDMRHKENKEAATKKDQPKLKADGTPDKRYKENKEAEAPKPNLKADGMPDKRYKKNQTTEKKK